MNGHSKLDGEKFPRGRYYEKELYEGMFGNVSDVGECSWPLCMINDTEKEVSRRELLGVCVY
jgi:hypothetical protein